MVGQEYLLSVINKQLNDGTFPRFSIITGPKGSGKKMTADYIASSLHGIKSVSDISVDSVRSVISTAYKVDIPTVYIFADADNMSLAAKNALLKVTEEPPNNAYFVMTLESPENTLETIRSRGTVFHMDNYTPNEILKYGKFTTNDTLHSDEAEVIIDICETPGEVDALLKSDIMAFYNYMKLVVDSVAEVTLANALKIGNKIALKSDEDKYDIRLFFKAFMKICVDNLEKDPLKYSRGVKITSRYIQELRINGVNKSALFSNWVIDIQESWSA